MILKCKINKINIMKTNFRLFLGCILLVFLNFNLKAQTFEDYKKQQAKGQNELKLRVQNDISKMKEQINQYIAEKDKEFANYLNTQWENYNLYKAKKADIKPKPATIPVFNKIEAKKTDLSIPFLNSKKTIANVNLSMYDSDVEIPVLEKDENNSFETNVLHISFYGKSLMFEFDKNFLENIPEKINEKTISMYWESMSSCNYNHLLDQLETEKTNMKLNDWGYYQLINNYSKSVYKKNANLLTWYLLLRSGYKVRIGYNNNEAFILIPTLNSIYDKPYYTFDNVNYYLFDSKYNNVYTYKKDFPNANKLFDFSIYRPMDLGGNYVEKNLKTRFDNTDLDINILVKNENIKFYKDYPLTDINVFYNAPVSLKTRESLKLALSKFIENKTEEEALNFLLHFVQKSFAYQTDDVQFGTEKFYFPEEIFVYPYSDCDDRVSLFSYLVRDLLNLEVIGIEYPGHIAAAVKTTQKLLGNYIIYNNQRYIIADPTYIGAPIGMSMPQFRSVSPTVVDLLNLYYAENQCKSILDDLISKGVISNKVNWVFDEHSNVIVSGYFDKELNIGNNQFKASEIDGKGAFIAKFNIEKQLIWIKQIKGLSSDNDIYTYCRNEKFFFTSSINEEISFNNKYFNSSKKDNIIAVMLDENGNIIWMKTIIPDEIEFKKGLTAIGKLNKAGDIEWVNYIDNYKNINGLGIIVDDNENVYLKVMNK